MGIRIHKILGWGLRYTKGTEDPRLSQEVLCGDVQISKKEILEYIDSSESIWKGSASLFEHDLKQELYDLYDFLHFGPEYSKRPFLVFSLRGTNHFRYDDIIDYYDVAPQENKVKMIVDEANQITGIHPYYNFVNRHTGQNIERMYPSQRWSFTQVCFNMLEKDPTNISKIDSAIQQEYGKFGINSFIEWQRDITVEPSPIIDALIELSGIFEDKRMKLRLKPMLVSYWE